MMRTETAFRTACVLVIAFVTATTPSLAQDDAADAARLMKALEIKAGLSVAEIGAGAGALTLAMAREVGASGHIYSTELGDDRVQKLQEAVTRANVPRVNVLTGAPAATNLPEGCCDAVFMRVVYHHFADPPAMNASLLRSLRPGGRLAVIDFLPRRGEAEMPEDRDEGDHHGVTPDTVVRELKEAGFEIVSTEPPKDRNFMVVARKPS